MRCGVSPEDARILRGARAGETGTKRLFENTNRAAAPDPLKARKPPRQRAPGRASRQEQI